MMEPGTFFENVDESSRWLRTRAGLFPEVTLVLSAGLGGLVDGMTSAVSISSSDIPNFPRARAEGHEGRLVFGELCGVPAVAMCGRFHFYEGHSPQEIVFPHFVLERLGVRTLITTNAAGGVRKSFRAGDLMLVSDHINMMGMNPLVGIAIQRPHDQFTSLTEAYDPGLRAMAKRVAKEKGIALKEGVYLAVSGPSYETKAEIAAFRKLGADAIGMSTVPEVIAANFLGMKALSLSCIANPAADLHRGRMNHAEVLAAMKGLSSRAVALLEALVERTGRS